MVYMMFDGYNLKDEFTILDVRGRGILQNEVELIEVAGKAGAYFSHRKIPIRVLEVDVAITGDNPTDLRKRIRKINKILSVDEPKPIVFSDDPEITYHGIPEQSSDSGDIVSTNTSTIVFVCADPYSYSPEIKHEFESDVTRVVNNGSEESEPIFQLEVLKPVTYALIQNQNNEYMMIGEPYDMDSQKPIKEEERILWDEMNSLNTWVSADRAEGGIVAGNVITDGYRFMPESFGSGSGWHGPSVKRTIPNAPIQDFRLDVLVEFWNTNDEGNKTGRLDIDLLNASDEVVAKLSLNDSQFGANVTVGQARAGKGDVQSYLINEHGDYPGVWNNFYGILRIVRKGTYWEAYISKINPSTGRHHSSRWTSWRDVNGLFLDEITQIQIYFGKFGNYTEIPMSVHDVKVWRYNKKEPHEVPYIADVGDIITFDHRKHDLMINGESRLDIKDFGASFFTLKRGENQLIVHPSDSFKTTLFYRETSR